MKKTVFFSLTIFLIVSVSAPLAMSHGGKDHSKGEIHKKEKMDMREMGDDHSSMEGMTDQMIMLGVATQNGVKAKAHIMDVAAKMAEAGKEETHHIMTAFEDADGKKLQPKIMAVKVTKPNGKSGKAQKLMGMDGLYGANVMLKEKGLYAFNIVMKLDSGKKYSYKFEYHLK